MLFIKINSKLAKKLILTAAEHETSGSDNEAENSESNEACVGNKSNSVKKNGILQQSAFEIEKCLPCMFD